MFSSPRGWAILIACLPCIILTYGVSPLIATELEAESRLVAATVYPQRATLIREAVVDVPAGAGVIVFRGLPAQLQTDSLRAEGQGDGVVRFSALTYRLESQSELIAPRERELAARIEQIRDQRNGVEAERQALTTQRKFLEQLASQAGNRIGDEIAVLRLNPDEWLQAADSVGQAMQRLLKVDLALQITLRELNRTLVGLEQELSQLQTGSRNSYLVRLPLEADQPTRLTIRLSYQVPGVSWRPLYDVRLETDSGQLSLIQYGAVRQQTGEDWQDIRLVLSTAQPHRGTSLPELTPFWVDLYDPAVVPQTMSRDLSKMAAPSMNMESALDMAAENGAGRGVETEFAEADIRSVGFVSEYAIPGRISVAADGTETKLLCGAFATENRMEIQVKPQISNEAFVVSRAVLQASAPLLPGTASLFRDGAYVGRLHLPLLRPGQTQEIGFGIDDRIAVTRNILKDMRSDPTLLSRENQRERHVANLIGNRSAKELDVVVLETIPAGRHDRIKVDILKEHTTAGYEQDVDDVKGLLRWRLQLTGGEESRLTLGWRVSWPKDQELSGL